MRLSDAAFARMKQDLARRRKEAMEDLVRELKMPEEVGAWITSVPKAPPHYSLNEYCNRHGGTVAVPIALGSGLACSAVEFFEGEDMISHAASLSSQGHKVALLNMANATSVGGGFLSGARAQEEQLCHRSTLFLKLKQYRWYGNYPIRRGTCLLTPDVRILLGHDFAPQQEASVSVVSACANRYATEADARKDKDLLRSLRDTWLAVLSAAAASGSEIVVVSAIGCGAFQNPPEAAGRALASALSDCSPGRLRRVHVAILEDHNSRDNTLRFRKGFDDAFRS